MNEAPEPQILKKDDHLAMVPFAGKLSANGRSLLLNTLQIAQYPKGTFVKSECEKVKHLPILISGAMRVFKSSPSGRSLTLYRLNSKDTCLLATYCILSDTAFPAEAIVDQSSKVLLIPIDTFKSLYAEEKAVQDFVVTLGLHQILKLIMIIEEIAFKRLDKRLAQFLVVKFSENSQKPAPMQMSHQEIADELGTAREVVSRLLSEFESNDYVSLARRQIEIKDPDALQHIAQDIHVT